MPIKIVKCILVPDENGVITFQAEDGRDTSDLRLIYPDDNGDLYYWSNGN